MIWKNLLLDLKTAGLTQMEIASICGTAQAAISDLANGKIRNPSHPTGEAIIELHKKTMRKYRRANSKDMCAGPQIQTISS